MMVGKLQDHQVPELTSKVEQVMQRAMIPSSEAAAKAKAKAEQKEEEGRRGQGRGVREGMQQLHVREHKDAW